MGGRRSRCAQRGTHRRDGNNNGSTRAGGGGDATLGRRKRTWGCQHAWWWRRTRCSTGAPPTAGGCWAAKATRGETAVPCVLGVVAATPRRRIVLLLDPLYAPHNKGLLRCSRTGAVRRAWPATLRLAANGAAAEEVARWVALVRATTARAGGWREDARHSASEFQVTQLGDAGRVTHLQARRRAW